MFDNMENLKLISSSQGIALNRLHVENRKTHCLIFRTCGSGTYIFDDKTLVVDENKLIFLPKGCSYKFQTTSKDECRYSSIQFEADLSGTEPMLYSLENFSEASYIFSHIPNLWKFGNQPERYKCYSMFYSIISYISNIENTDYYIKKKFQLIEPAVNYLKEHIFDSSLKADKLHLLCGISDTYFRKIFVSKFAATPQQYIISKRISHAKSIIDTGNFDTIGEVAASVGYDDPLYFSRAFKKKYGISPSNLFKTTEITRY